MAGMWSGVGVAHVVSLASGLTQARQSSSS